MAGQYKARGSVKVDMSALDALRSNPEPVLRALDEPVRDAVRRGMDQAAFLVPRGGAPDDPVDLADTAFISGPEHNLTKRLSTTFTGGYEHPQAGPIHEGFHWGVELPPPHWLRRAFKRGVRALLIKGVASRLQAVLSKYFPKK